MRTLAITQNITLDGSIEMLGDWFAAQGGDVDMSDLLEVQHRHMGAADAFLAGRQTFEDLRGYWPTVIDEDTTGVSAYLNDVHKYVVSSTITDPAWQNTTVLSGDPVAEVRALKEQPGRDIVVTGSITLCHTLIEAGLVDEYRLYTFPVVQGRGRRLFPDGFEVPTLRRLDVQAFRSGITYSSFAPENP
ncbi:dihydrofolate reductase [Herbihabitans rhizosphaerae]|uniref:Dihydrofolate reductase n=1 Tax=Herbihabitans rhizosphaerae TaxID=1872711 RepID=A0A4V2EU84_9PSEU|nr:dihydrofolate reductase family protein [Herbihabitans rhizosphaerae]RZS43683.1 dihydrofolate reductase [Herbihabitans rhizosphaerae]